MIRLTALVLGVIALGAVAAPASAQTWVNGTWSEPGPRPGSSITAELNRQPAAAQASRQPVFVASTAAFIAPTAVTVPAFGPVVEYASDFTPSPETNAFAATTTRDVWREGEGHSDRLRLRTRGVLRRADGSPLPLTPQDVAAFDAEGYDVSFTRGWPVARGYTASGLEVSLTPHAGIGVGDRGGRAEAGATLRIGSDLDDMVPEGADAFGERARWYLYAAGSGTAVGYNFARNRDGDYARSGVSRDSGSFLGDASIGVALRKGDIQGSFGIVYRELEAEGLRGGEGFDRDVTEGLVAFQLSIKPE